MQVIDDKSSETLRQLKREYEADLATLNGEEVGRKWSHLRINLYNNYSIYIRGDPVGEFRGKGSNNEELPPLNPGTSNHILQIGLSFVLTTGVLGWAVVIDEKVMDDVLIREPNQWMM